MLSKFKKKTREKIHRIVVWAFLFVFVFTVAAASILTMIGHPAAPAK